MSNLDKLTNDFLEILENEELKEEELEVQLNSINFEIEEKADAYAYILKKYKNDMEFLKKEEERLYNKRKNLEKTNEFLKQTLKQNFEKLEINKMKTKLNSFYFTTTTSVKIDDLAKIPKEFIKIKQIEEVDKKELKKLMDEGEIIEGVYLQKNKNLIIK